MYSCIAILPSVRINDDDDDDDDDDVVLSWTFDLLFQSSGITSYASIDGSAIRSHLDAVTVALWLRTSDRQNQGTPLSYATDERDNELAITDCNGFVIYVAGSDEVTDVSVADGTWHHIAVTWSSRDGLWNIYKDGLRQDGGRGLAAERFIRGFVLFIVVYSSFYHCNVHKSYKFKK